MNTDEEAWSKCSLEDLWIFDKLIVAKKSGHVCGPRGINVPKEGNYIVRPIINIGGFGEQAKVVYLKDETWDLHPGEFWCEIFDGPHLSIDYSKYEPILSVIGTPHPIHKYTRFTKWEITDTIYPLPSFIGYTPLRYKNLNCEFIGGKLIEIHLRSNPDFAYNNSSAIPYWIDEPDPQPKGYTFIPDNDGNDFRKGIWVKCNL